MSEVGFPGPDAASVPLNDPGWYPTNGTIVQLSPVQKFDSQVVIRTVYYFKSIMF